MVERFGAETAMYSAKKQSERKSEVFILLSSNLHIGFKTGNLAIKAIGCHTQLNMLSRIFYSPHRPYDFLTNSISTYVSINN